MQIIKPSVEIIDEPNIAKKIELCARNCYKSEDKITDDSAMKMVRGLIKRGHESPLEHTNIIAETWDSETTIHMRHILNAYERRTFLPHLIRNCGGWREEAGFDDSIWSGNIRAWRSIVRQFNGEPLLQVLFSDNIFFADLFDGIDTRLLIDMVDEPCTNARIIETDPKDRDCHKIVTARIISDRGVLGEITRHRLFSFSVESTRYVSYNNDGITVIEPWWKANEDYLDGNHDAFAEAMLDSERWYNVMQKDVPNPAPQKSRAVLPLATKSDMIVTGTVDYWKNIVMPLRTSKAAHPDIVRVMNMVKEQMGW